MNSRGIVDNKISNVEFMLQNLLLVPLIYEVFAAASSASVSICMQRSSHLLLRKDPHVRACKTTAKTAPENHRAHRVIWNDLAASLARSWVHCSYRSSQSSYLRDLDTYAKRRWQRNPPSASPITMVLKPKSKKYA